MGKWDLAGIHGINKYVWSILVSELGWSTTPYGGLVPITTPQQESEFNAIDAPYIVYSYSKTDSGDDYWLEPEVAAYTIFSSSEKVIRQVTNLLVAKLGRVDESAQVVNNYIGTAGTDDQKAFDYKMISASNAQGAQPSLQEGGRYDGLVVLRYTYTHSNPTTGLSIRY